MNYYSYNSILRSIFRLSLFGAPTAGVAYLGSYESTVLVNEINEKYLHRFIKFKRTGDVKYLDPDDMIFQNMMASAKMMGPPGGMMF